MDENQLTPFTPPDIIDRISSLEKGEKDPTKILDSLHQEKKDIYPDAFQNIKEMRGIYKNDSSVLEHLKINAAPPLPLPSVPEKEKPTTYPTEAVKTGVAKAAAVPGIVASWILPTEKRKAPPGETPFALPKVVEHLQNIGIAVTEDFYRGSAALSKVTDDLGTYISDKFFGGTLTKQGLFKVLSEELNKNVDCWAHVAEERGISFFDELIGQTVGFAVPGAAQWKAGEIGAIFMGAAEAYSANENVLKGALVEGAKRGTLGLSFELLSHLPKKYAIPVTGAIFGTQSAVEGGTLKDITQALGTGILVASLPGGSSKRQKLINDLSSAIKEKSQSIKEGRSTEDADKKIDKLLGIKREPSPAEPPTLSPAPVSDDSGTYITASEVDLCISRGMPKSLITSGQNITAIKEWVKKFRANPNLKYTPPESKTPVLEKGVNKDEITPHVIEKTTTKILPGSKIPPGMKYALRDKSDPTKLYIGDEHVQSHDQIIADQITVENPTLTPEAISARYEAGWVDANDVFHRSEATPKVPKPKITLFALEQGTHLETGKTEPVQNLGQESSKTPERKYTDEQIINKFKTGQADDLYPIRIDRVLRHDKAEALANIDGRRFIIPLAELEKRGIPITLEKGALVPPEEAGTTEYQEFLEGFPRIRKDEMWKITDLGNNPEENIIDAVIKEGGIQSGRVKTGYPGIRSPRLGPEWDALKTFNIKHGNRLLRAEGTLEDRPKDLNAMIDALKRKGWLSPNDTANELVQKLQQAANGYDQGETSLQPRKLGQAEIPNPRIAERKVWEDEGYKYYGKPTIHDVGDFPVGTTVLVKNDKGEMVRQTIGTTGEKLTDTRAIYGFKAPLQKELKTRDGLISELQNKVEVNESLRNRFLQDLRHNEGDWAINVLNARAKKEGKKLTDVTWLDPMIKSFYANRYAEQQLKFSNPDEVYGPVKSPSFVQNTPENIEKLVNKYQYSKVQAENIDKALTVANLLQKLKTRTQPFSPEMKAFLKSRGVDLSDLKSIGGVNFSEELRTKGRLYLNGLEVKDPWDVAALSTIIRNPQAEVFVVYFCKDGKLLNYSMYTNRLPGSVSYLMRPEDYHSIVDTANKLGANQVWTGHNHIGGPIYASASDIEINAVFTQWMKIHHPEINFKGHIIVDSGEFSFMHFDDPMDPLNVKSYKLDKYKIQTDDAYMKKYKDHPLLGMFFNTASDVADVLKRHRSSPENQMLMIYTDSKHKCNAVHSAPLKLLENEKDFVNYINKGKEAFGGRYLFVSIGKEAYLNIPHGGEEVLNESIKKGNLLNYIYFDEHGVGSGVSNGVRGKEDNFWLNKGPDSLEEIGAPGDPDIGFKNAKAIPETKWKTGDFIQYNPGDGKPPIKGKVRDIGTRKDPATGQDVPTVWMFHREDSRLPYDNRGAASTTVDADKVRSQTEIKPPASPLGFRAPSTVDPPYYRGPVNKQAMEMPEMVEMVQKINHGKLPQIVEKIKDKRGKVLGGFIPTTGRLKLIAEIFKNPRKAVEVLSHEIGHLWDWLPDEDKRINRGNILGQIGSFKEYMDEYLGEYPGAPGKPITLEEKADLWDEALKQSQEGIITESRKPTPEEITAIWNNLTATDPKLMDYVQRLSDAQKAELVRSAMKGFIPDWMNFHYGKIEREDVRKIFDRMIKNEVIKRALYEHKVIEKELKDLTHEWNPFDPAEDKKYTKYRYSPEELYAESISVLLNNPSLLKNKAPNFYKGLFAYLEKKPSVKATYQDIMDRLAGDPKEVYNNRKTRFLSGSDKREEQLKNYSGDLQAPSTKQKVAEAFVYKNWRAMQLMEKVSTKYAIEDNTYRGSEGQAYIREQGNKVLKIIDDAHVGHKDWGWYLFLKETAEQLEGRERAAPIGETKEAAKHDLDMLKREVGEEKFNAMEAARKEFWKVRQEYIIPRVRAARLFSEDLMHEITTNQYYITHDVIKEIIDKLGSAQSGFYIHKRLGTFHDINDPYFSTIMKDMALLRAVNYKNAAYHVCDDLLTGHHRDMIMEARKEFTGKFMRAVPPAHPDWGMIQFMEDGKTKAYYVPKYVSKIFERNPLEAAFIGKLFRSISDPFRELFVRKNPGFWAFLAWRSARSAVMTTPGLTIPTYLKLAAKHLGPAYRYAKGYDELGQKLLREKGLIPSVDYSGVTDEDTVLDRMMIANGYGKPQYHNKIYQEWKKFTDGMNILTTTMYTYPKMAVYDFLKTKYPHMSDQEIAWRIRRAGTPPYLVKGEFTPVSNNFFLFSNDAIQSWKMHYEAFRENPIEYGWKMMKFTVIPKLILLGVAQGLFGAEAQDIFNEQSDYTKTNYFPIPIGRDARGKGICVTIPLDPNSREVGGILWKAMTGVKSPADLFKIFDYTSAQFPHLNPLLSMVWDTMSFMGGHNPLDAFHQTYMVPEEVMKAAESGEPEDIWRKYKYFLRNIANQTGIGVVYKFRNEEPEKLKSELEEKLGWPVLSNTIGRFVKVSNRGITELTQEHQKVIAGMQASMDISTREAVAKILEGRSNELTEKQIVSMIQKSKTIPHKFLVMIARQYGQAWLEAYERAPGKVAKLQVIQDMFEAQQKHKRVEEGGGLNVLGIR